MKKQLLLILNFSFILFANAQTWSPLGQGLGSNAVSLTVFNNHLYAVGWFVNVEGNLMYHAARWNGSSWSAANNSSVGTVIDGNPATSVVYNGNLYIGGEFGVAGGITAKRIAKYNGTTWSGVGGGMPEIIAKVYALAVYNGNLYAGGYFTTAGSATAGCIAKWNGTAWSAVGTGIASDGSVKALAEYNGELYAAGWFTTFDGNTISKIAKWDGSAWSEVGSGISDDVYALAVFNGELYAGGAFTSAGGVSVNNIAKWNGTAWSAVGSGTDGTVMALHVFNSKLYVGGNFNQAGGNTANRIAQWNGSTWSGLGSGMDGSVYALTDYNGSLYAGGGFTNAGGAPANYIARWGSPTGLDEADEKLFSIYPNPASNSITIELDATLRNANCILRITNTLGEVVYQSTITNPKSAIALSAFSPGIYIISVFDGEKQMNRKIIKE